MTIARHSPAAPAAHRPNHNHATTSQLPRSRCRAHYLCSSGPPRFNPASPHPRRTLKPPPKYHAATAATGSYAETDLTLGPDERIYRRRRTTRPHFPAQLSGSKENVPDWSQWESAYVIPGLRDTTLEIVLRHAAATVAVESGGCAADILAEAFLPMLDVHVRMFDNSCSQ